MAYGRYQQLGCRASKSWMMNKNVAWATRQTLQSDVVNIFKKTRGAREPKSKPLVEKNKCVRFESLLTSLVPCLQRLHIFFHIFFSRGNQLGALQTPAQTPGNRYMKKTDVSGLNHVWVPGGNKNQPRSHKHLAFKTTFPYRKKDLDNFGY